MMCRSRVIRAVVQLAVFVSCIATCFADATPAYTPPPGWEGLVAPGITISPPNYWQLRTTDITYAPALAGPLDASDADVAKRWNKRVPQGWELVLLDVAEEHGCSGHAWWVRRTIERQKQFYRQIRLEFRRGDSMAMLMYDLRSNAEKEDPAVRASFLAYCKRD
jgi:hypothetical protein